MAVLAAYGRLLEKADARRLGEKVLYWYGQRRKPEPSPRPESGAVHRRRLAQERLAAEWERAMALRWSAAGRLTADGTLRVPAELAPRWTIRLIRKTWPHLRWRAAVAVLILANGVLEDGDMAAKEAIREVLEEMVEVKLSVIFGELLADLRRPVHARTGGTGGRDAGSTRVYRVRHPETRKLVTREERDAFLARKNGDAARA